MAYSHGIKWTDKKIEEEIKIVIKKLCLDRMPSASEMNNATANYALSNIIAKSGGFIYWSNKLNLNMKDTEYSKGYKYENIIKKILEKMGYTVEMMSTKHPYDLLVNNHIKIDVKVSNLFINENVGEFHTFNVEKSKPTCDIYIAITVVGGDVERIFIIPSKYLQITQLSVGRNSKYNKYIDRWDFIKKYDYFYQETI